MHKTTVTSHTHCSTSTTIGTYGSVCRGVHRITKQIRAIKSISKSSSQVKNLDRFKQEIAIMKFVDHPNIVKLYETYEDHRNIYLVRDY